ncbi:hypothetical protein CO613_04250 [Lysobacteraceae bacterium NML07-0707]|nr:hypothetical protein CO613_04250 [Xanthomonadaceae bacterium NML07-0707]
MNTNDMQSGNTLEKFFVSNPQFNDPATLAGLAALIDKLAPLLQSGRLHNGVDALSALADVVDLADDAMIQKLARGFEEASSAMFNLHNGMEYALEQAADSTQLPSVWQAIGLINRDQDVRRGLLVVIGLLRLLGRQARLMAMPMPED